MSERLFVEIVEKILQFIVGITFIYGGIYISKSALESKNMIESCVFGLLGVMVGFFLLSVVFCGAPGGPG